MIHRPLRWIKKKFNTVMELRDDKRSVAAGVAIGFFWGFTPLLGLKTALAFVTAWITRTNKIAAVVAVSLHDLLLPLYLVYFPLSYHVGLWLLSTEKPMTFKQVMRLLAIPAVDLPDGGWYHVPHLLYFIGQLTKEYWNHLFHNIHYLLPLLVGSMVLAIPPTIGVYFLSIYSIERLAQRDARRDAERRAQELGHDHIPYQTVDDKHLRILPDSDKSIPSEEPERRAHGTGGQRFGQPNRRRSDFRPE